MMQRLAEIGVSGSAELSSAVENLILEGVLPEGHRLEPVRVVAEELGLAPNTVAAAYRRLGDMGLVVGRGRSGTFVTERYHARGDLVDEPEPGLIDLASGRPDPALLPDLAKFLSDLPGPGATYGERPVSQALVDAVSPLLVSDGIPVSTLAVTGGALDGVERALAAWLRPGHAVVVEDPGWFALTELVKAMGMTPIPVPIDEQGLLPDSLDEALERARAVLLTPRAQNPTGATVTAARSEELAKVLSNHPEVLVVEDDHMGPTSGSDLHSVAATAERFAYVRSFAKSYGPDLRTAVLAGDDITVERVQGRQLVGPGWVSHILQRTVAKLVDSTSVCSLLKRATTEYSKRRQAAVAAFREAGFDGTGASGLNVWVQVRDEERAVAAARDAGFAIRPGRRFRHSAPPAVRITVAELDVDLAGRLAHALRDRSLPETRQV